MTFNEMMNQYLQDNGMFESQAEAVIDLAQGHEIFEAMKNNLNKDMAEYSGVFERLCIHSLKVVAIEYIDKECPMAWFRTVFLPESEQRKLMPEAFVQSDQIGGMYMVEDLVSKAKLVVDVRSNEAKSTRPQSAPHTFAVPYGQGEQEDGQGGSL